MMRPASSKMRASSPHNLFDTPDGFYFRQRKGILNLRKLESIDLEKLVREVDIELLQQHLEDITFCEFNEELLHFLTDRNVLKLFKISQLVIEYLLFSQNQLVETLGDLSTKYAAKKRSLHQKRKELASLKEESQNLNEELGIKRRNLRSLQKAVKGAAVEKLDYEAQTSAPVLAPVVNSLCIYITLPDGVCIEMTQHPKTLISTIESVVRNSLITASKAKYSSLPCKFYHQGKMLLLDATLESVGIKNYDTILAVFESLEPAPQNSTTFCERLPDNQNTAALEEQLQLIRAMASQMRSLEKPSETPSQKEDKPIEVCNAALNGIQMRLYNIESELKESATRPNQVQTRLVFGELENDKDDVSGALFEINNKLSESLSKVDFLDSKISSLHSLREVVSDQRRQIDELKLLLLSQPIVAKEIEQQPKSQVLPVLQKVKQPLAKSQPLIVDPAANKWNNLPSSSSNVSASMVSMEPVQFSPKPTKPVVIETPILAKPSPVVLPPKVIEITERTSEVSKSPESAPAIVDSVKPINVFEEHTVVKVVETPIDDSKLDFIVDFPISFNPTLAAWGLSNFYVKLDPHMKDDEIIIAIRKELSGHAKIPYSHTSLMLDNYQVKLAVDLQHIVANFSVQDARNLALSGRLRVVIKSPKVTNTQIDLLSSFRQSDPTEVASVTTSPYSELRASLNSLLHVGDSGGLSDHDLSEKRNLLERMIGTQDNSQLRRSRHSVIKSVGYVTSESESDYVADDRDFAKLDWKDDNSDWQSSSYTRVRRRNFDSMQADPTTHQIRNTNNECDLNQTIDSELNNVAFNHFSEKSVLRHADEYERDANQSMESPFDGSGTESHDHSLALSDSNNFIEGF